jgi:hypothetical protein
MSPQQVETQSREDAFFGQTVEVGPRQDDLAPTEDTSGITVEVIDDRPPGDQRPAHAKGSLDDDDDEVGEYSDRVNKRINKLNYQKNEQRRIAETAGRERDAAVDYAQSLQTEVTRQGALLRRGAASFAEQIRDKAKSDVELAERKLRDATTEGDTGNIVDATRDLSMAAGELQTAERDVTYAAQQALIPQQPQPQQQQRPSVVGQPPQQQQAAPKVDERATAWVETNKDWFNNPEHPDMTALAYGTHQRLADQGVDLESDEYYAELDRIVRVAFPDYDNFQQAEGTPQSGQGNPQASTVVQTPRSNVAPASSGGGAPSGQRIMKLTASQVQVARRLGITKEQYAAQLIKENG